MIVTKLDAHDGFAKSLEEGYRVIRERVAASSPKVGAEMTRRKQPEAQLQRALVERARGDRWWTHIPTGGRRSPTEALICKSLGVRASSPDPLIRAGPPLFLELKAPYRKLSAAQVECHAALPRAGAQIETVNNIDAALAFLCRLGVLR